MRSTSLRTLAAVLVSAVLLVGCVPAATTGDQPPLVAVLNAPSQSVVWGSAEAVHEELRGDPDRGFALVSPFSMRFLETHTDLFHDQAAPSAGRIARNQRADLAVMIGAPVLEREITLSNDEASRRIDVLLVLEAQVVDPRTDSVVQALRTRRHEGSRVEANDTPLPEASEDPTVRALAQRAAVELALSLKAELPYLFSELLIGSSGG